MCVCVREILLIYRELLYSSRASECTAFSFFSSEEQRKEKKRYRVREKRRKEKKNLHPFSQYFREKEKPAIEPRSVQN